MKNNNGYYQTVKDLTNNQDTSLKKQLEQLVPEAFLDGVLDLNSLKKLLENNEINFDEKQNNLFGLYWNGKSKAWVNAFSGANSKTLKPLKEKSLNFIKTNNVVIEGENLDVLKTLQKSYHKQVDVIYIDPPYNTGNDFVYNDDFKIKEREYKLDNSLIDEEGFKTTTNQKTSGRFHTKWLNMIYPRLLLSKNLLKENGIIFISIDDNEYARLKLICDEIFGQHNFITSIIWRKKNTGGGSDKITIETETEYILTYAKNKHNIQFSGQKVDSLKYTLKDEYFSSRGKYNLTDLDRVCSLSSFKYVESLDYLIQAPDGTLFKNHRNILKPKSYCYTLGKDLFDFCNINGFIEIKKTKEGYWKAYRKSYELVTIDRKNYKIIPRLYGNSFNNIFESNNNFIDVGSITSSSGKRELIKLIDDKDFSFPKPVSLIKHLVNLHTNKDGLILDFFAGSGTTAQAVMELNKEDGGNRKYILVQLPEIIENNSEFKTICDITTARIKRSIDKYDYKDKGFKYFKLTDSHFKTWKLFSNSKNEEFHQQLNLYEDESTKQNQPEDILYEIILKEGLPLDLDILIKKYNNYSYWTDSFFEYLFLLNFVKEFNDAVINDFLKIIQSTVKESKTGNELRVFMLEDFFKIKNGDEHKINLCEQIKMLGGGYTKSNYTSCKFDNLHFC